MGYTDQIKKSNEEILKFLVKNEKKLVGHQLSIFHINKFKDVKSLVKELISKSKNPAILFKIGMEDKKNNVINYGYKKRTEMEKLLNSGNLGYIDIRTTNVEGMTKAIDKFGKSS